MSSERKQSFHRGDAKGAEKNLFVWRTEGSGLFSEEIPLNKKIPVVLIPDPFYLPWPLRRLDLNPKGKKLLIQSPFPDWIRIKSSLCASAVKRNTTEQGDSERKTILEFLQVKSSCGMGFNLPIRQCEAPPFKAGGQALLRVNLSAPRPLGRGAERFTSCTFQNPLDSCLRSGISAHHHLPRGSMPKLPSVLLTR